MIQFDAVLKRRLELIREVLKFKETVYAKDGDRYHNFKVAARMVDTTPEKALKGMLLKHEVSVMDLIEHAEHNPEKLNTELIEEKIGDNINYLILLEGMLKERLAHKYDCMGQYDSRFTCCKTCDEVPVCRCTTDRQKEFEDKREIVPVKCPKCNLLYGTDRKECPACERKGPACFSTYDSGFDCCKNCERVDKCMEATNER